MSEHPSAEAARQAIQYGHVGITTGRDRQTCFDHSAVKPLRQSVCLKADPLHRHAGLREEGDEVSPV